MINGEGNAYYVKDNELSNDTTNVNISFTAPMLGAFKNKEIVNNSDNPSYITSGLYLGEITYGEGNNKTINKQLLTYYNGVKTCVIDDEGNVLIDGLEDEIKAIIRNAFIEKTSLENVNIDNVNLTNVKIDGNDFNPTDYKPSSAAIADNYNT